MRRPLLRAALAILPILFIGCYHSLGPDVHVGDRVHISGVVRLPDGHPYPYAEVSTDTGSRTCVDKLGRYKIAVSCEGRSVTLTAGTSCQCSPDSRFAVTYSGSATVMIEGPTTTTDIVLDHSVPF
jgi:hypothetical protein